MFAIAATRQIDSACYRTAMFERVDRSVLDVKRFIKEIDGLRWNPIYVIHCDCFGVSEEESISGCVELLGGESQVIVQARMFRPPGIIDVFDGDKEKASTSPQEPLEIRRLFEENANDSLIKKYRIHEFIGSYLVFYNPQSGLARISKTLFLKWWFGNDSIYSLRQAQNSRFVGCTLFDGENTIRGLPVH